MKLTYGFLPLHRPVLRVECGAVYRQSLGDFLCHPTFICRQDYLGLGYDGGVHVAPSPSHIEWSMPWCE
ncbi:hypothetical protein [Pleomorphovibrio marinus]|uniref:hypothetical protein n=1 Tax=Pleomorphovibrio marinus TaxID=2164132 RepID=UPI0013001BDC|nr:hypothetical protein [Pleomorphovibrio marinus]